MFQKTTSYYAKPESFSHAPPKQVLAKPTCMTNTFGSGARGIRIACGLFPSAKQKPGISAMSHAIACAVTGAFRCRGSRQALIVPFLENWLSAGGSHGLLQAHTK